MNQKQKNIKNRQTKKHITEKIHPTKSENIDLTLAENTPKTEFEKGVA